jgi:GNAT superfamily N-acetyltransferase
VRFELDPPLTSELRNEIISLWTDVSNAGGAVGFVPPVTQAEVAVTANETFDSVQAGHDHLVLGFDGEGLAAMLVLVSRRFNLSEHWRTIKRVMVRPGAQGKGYGAAIMREGERVARELGLEGLYLTVRSGHGTEKFYARLGYKEVGRLPGSLRIAPGDDRDEILMWLLIKA